VDSCPLIGGVSDECSSGEAQEVEEGAIYPVGLIWDGKDKRDLIDVYTISIEWDEEGRPWLIGYDGMSGLFDIRFRVKRLFLTTHDLENMT
jgi:hypothetical protein